LLPSSSHSGRMDRHAHTPLPPISTYMLWRRTMQAGTCVLPKATSRLARRIPYAKRARAARARHVARRNRGWVADAQRWLCAAGLLRCACVAGAAWWAGLAAAHLLPTCLPPAAHYYKTTCAAGCYSALRGSGLPLVGDSLAAFHMHTRATTHPIQHHAMPIPVTASL